MTIRDLLVVPNERKRGIRVYINGEEEVSRAEPVRMKVKARCAFMFFDLRVKSHEGVVLHK